MKILRKILHLPESKTVIEYSDGTVDTAPSMAEAEQRVMRRAINESAMQIANFRPQSIWERLATKYNLRKYP